MIQPETKCKGPVGHFEAANETELDHFEVLAERASELVESGEYEQALALLKQIPSDRTEVAEYWLNYGHTLRAVGRSDEAITAYRKCMRLDPAFMQAWLALANLKTYRFSSVEIDTMRELLKRGADLCDEDRCYLEFSLGKALEDAGAYADSFAHYRDGNALRRPRVQYDAAKFASNAASVKAVFTQKFFHARVGLGCVSADPIFIVGMPRAGSTLIEQILSSHSAVEGTAELPDIMEILRDLGSRRDGGEKCDATVWKQLGERYLEATRPQRRLGRPFFTDKAGGNFQFAGLIHVVLPNAKIIDARRHPMACSFSGYKQYFHGDSMSHTYDIAEAGRHYRIYVELMAHFDKVLPGRIHRVFHEDLVRDPEAVIRRLLNYCGLPFEESCLNFHETRRAVQTFSSEQVRRPIYAPAIEPWRHYEEWLAPMKAELGGVLTIYPAVPVF